MKHDGNPNGKQDYNSERQYEEPNPGDKEYNEGNGRPNNNNEGREPVPKQYNIQ